MSAIKRSAEASAGAPYKKRRDQSHDQTPRTESSKESHAKQKALALERKAAKPNADSIQRAKKLWERLRLKSHVQLEERQKLVEELFGIVTGHVKDFVFKHDSVRVIQCALKYANVEQRKMIARELKGEYKQLAESRYAKFLVGKLLVQADDETRSWIIQEFYGNVKNMINHPEASWILDDTYRGVATPKQKAVLLKEWYGAEFALFRDDSDASLERILAANPEKRSTIMQHLQSLINQLVQKKLTGFTMLHDAMLQYFVITTPGGEEANEFLELLKGDEEGDLLKNLAFTPSGSKLVCYALAYGSAKDRKNILRVYKDHIETLAFDANGHLVLLAAYDVVDDTVMTSKLIFPELLGAKVVMMGNDLTARVPLLYPFAGMNKWLVAESTVELLKSLHAIRATTSKKDAEIRRKELVKSMSAVLLSTIAAQAAELVETSFGCQFITEVLLDAEGDKNDAIEAVVRVSGNLASSAAACRMLKTCALGGRFKDGRVYLVEPRLGFAARLFESLKDSLMDWAVGQGSFVVLGLVESEDFDGQKVVAMLRKEKNKLSQAAEEGNKGAKLLLAKCD